MSEPNKTPGPIGLIPERIYNRQCAHTRIGDIIDALHRYSLAKETAPDDWFTELRSRIGDLTRGQRTE